MSKLLLLLCALGLSSCVTTTLSVTVSDDGGVADSKQEATQTPTTDIKADIPVSLTK